ncbi:M15 family metallopeptidase [Desulfovibrio sp.]|uniref:M15 family metallopeptidase n=1 Tax=Desulfovibrio sp. TaxID=885 RepID=UPI0023CE93CD|nr:M15 family metallopeptidase [Desulfovibrio sp.]MDE7242206.1 M15 family metallopeptidase [Desulfovibrio sp.]
MRVHSVILCLLGLLLALPPAAWAEPEPAQAQTNAVAAGEEALDFHCLRQAYPALERLEQDAAGRQWLLLADGRRVLYRDAQPGAADVAASMAAPYPLEPERPPTPPGVAPGRLRPYDLFTALYGGDRVAVNAGLVTVPWPGRQVRLSPAAAQALERVFHRLAPLLEERPDLRPYLDSEGGFAWRRIAGEDRLSAHAFGIAIDLNARRAPYWRWSRQRPHPRQRDYPPEIVDAFEAEGFIWGGKWHEYDLMHFEYRPEIICKARLRAKALPVF